MFQEFQIANSRSEFNRGDPLSQLVAFSIPVETRYVSSALSSVLKTTMYVFLTIQLLSYWGVSNLTNSHHPNIYF